MPRGLICPRRREQRPIRQQRQIMPPPFAGLHSRDMKRIVQQRRTQDDRPQSREPQTTCAPAHSFCPPSTRYPSFASGFTSNSPNSAANARNKCTVCCVSLSAIKVVAVAVKCAIMWSVSTVDIGFDGRTRAGGSSPKRRRLDWVAQDHAILIMRRIGRIAAQLTISLVGPQAIEFRHRHKLHRPPGNKQ